MAQLSFETLTFREDKEKNVVNVNLLSSWTTEIPTEELDAIASFKIINPHTIEFNKLDNDKVSTKFSFLLDKHFNNLKSKLTNNPATYIHRNSGIPLLGNVAFGIVYRNSSIIEIKTNTGCNLNCIYCSISEGLDSKKHDFVVEKDYLVEELQKLIDFVNTPVEIHIGVQGEPFLYGDMENLIYDLQNMELVSKISIDTNGVLLSKYLIDKLSRCDKLQFNFSLDALNEMKAKEMAGTDTYNIAHIKRMIEHASEKMRLPIVAAPVFVDGLNNDEIEEIVKFIKSLEKQPVQHNIQHNIQCNIQQNTKQPILGIQNFLPYKTGKNPSKPISWDKFYQMLEELEKKHEIKLKLDKDFFNVKKTKELPKPFTEGDVVNAIIKCHDRFPNTVIAAAGDGCNARNISVASCEFKKDKPIRVKIARDKHNIFTGKLV